ncbi:MAG: hypothetical protein IJP78_05250, partial [Clostridia bacterium]|nr:hypothetical protein [Clostridia bacterium]
SFFPGIFPAFLGQKPSNFRISQRQADVVLFFSIQVDSPGWVQGQAALVQGFRGLKKPPASFHC